MPKYFLKYVLFLIALCFVCVFTEVKAAEETKDDTPFEEVICKSTTIRSIKDFNKLYNCTVVAGHVRIVDMEFTPTALKQLKSSNIEEISEYLLVFRVEGLDSLERLFPKLIVIRGVELLYDQYALSILENRDLKNIGLVSLLRVLKGSIRVEYNPSLCFTQTINWVWILGNNTKKYSFAMKNNKPHSQCPLCYSYHDEIETLEVNRHKKCWSHGKFQQTSWDYIGGKKCYKQGGESKCLTSCSDSNCRHCTNYVADTGCVDNCLPPRYRLAFKRQCVAKCSQWGLIQLGMECVEKCPKHYREVIKNDGTMCLLNCKGDLMIRNIKDLEGLADCTTIEGSLTLELFETGEPIVQHLEHAFRNLNEITGYLKISNCPQITSLHFFKNLHTIRGSQLIENRYSLYVVDNQYLQELWLGNVAILRGCIYFHLNSHLCYEKITDLQKNFRECKKITIQDASIHSNGERVVCGESRYDMNATIMDLNSTAAAIEISAVPFNELFLIIGYIYYYKEAPYRNVTKYDGRHGCGFDGWFTDVVLTKRRRHILKNLKPATQYAYFVHSMTTMDYPYFAEFISEIEYFQTLPTKPGMVAKLFYHSLSTKEIEIHWWPPRITNGVLEKYILQYEVTNATISSETLKINAAEVCQCPKLDTESKVPTPHAENYYNKERMLYKDSLVNFLIVKKTTSDRKTRDSSNSSLTETMDAAEARFLLALQELELRAFKRQDEGKEDYVLTHPLPVCNQTNPNIQDQTENKCIPLERYEGAIEIPSNRHAYILSNLQPEITYRISLRACVKDMENGCGPEKFILAETVSKRLETIIKNLTFHKL